MRIFTKFVIPNTEVDTGRVNDIQGKTTVTIHSDGENRVQGKGMLTQGMLYTLCTALA